MKQASLEENRQEYKRLIEERESILAQIAPLNERVDSLHPKIQQLREAIDEVELRTTPLTIEKALEYDPYESKARYKATKAFFDQMGLKSEGYFQETMQRDIHVTFYEKTDLVNLEESLKKVLPFVKPIEIKERFTNNTLTAKYIAFSEPSLSASGIHFMMVDEERGIYEFWRTTYGSSSKLETYNTMSEMLSTLKSKYNMDRRDRIYSTFSEPEYDD